MKRRRPFTGFVLSPIPACTTFSFGMLAFTLSGVGLLPLTWQELLLGTFITFFFSAAVAYPVTLIIGIPGYIILNKMKRQDIKSYVIGGLVFGGLSPLLSVFNIWY